MHYDSGDSFDFLADQGATLLRAITLKNSARKPVPIPGYTGRMQIRQSTTDTTVVQLLTTENGGITINATAATITILVTPAQTAALTANRYIYDLELEETETSIVTRILQGYFTVRAEVTK